jgi:hypothetical protein
VLEKSSLILGNGSVRGIGGSWRGGDGTDGGGPDEFPKSRYIRVEVDPWE